MASLAKPLPTNYGSMGRQQPYSFLKWDNDLEHASLQPDIAVKNDAFWSYCGPLLDPSASLPSSLHEFVAATFSATILPKFLPFLEFVHNFLAANGVGHYFITMRCTTPTHEFDQPRWHTDELFFSPTEDGRLPGTRLGLVSRRGKRKSVPKPSGTNWKMCASLLGPTTQFIPLKHQRSAREKQRQARENASTDHSCTSIRCNACAASAQVVRDQLEAGLAGCGVEAAGPGECAAFMVGRDNGAMHSEPSMSEPQHGRVFVNVVPGTEEELKGVMNAWGMEFPRHWWIGTELKAVQ